MTKSKTFWAAAALASLAVMAFAGYSIYERLSLHFSGDSTAIEVRPVPMPPAETVEDSKPPEGAAAAKEEPAAAEPQEKQAAKKADPAAKGEKQKAVKTAFEYKDAKAKSVKLAGSFSRWNDKPMKKGKNGVWRTEEYILPGTYMYHFTVDGKKKQDPGKPKAPNGESLVDVN